ncbi:MAG: DEAD/DEAH box helicase [Bacilli bacterium]
MYKKENLKNSNTIKNESLLDQYIVYEKIIPEKKATYKEIPTQVNPELATFLASIGINKLYSHQKKMFEEVEKGNNVVITTSTASGKTLSFLLPVINKILSNPLTRAIFVYPTKALASDQYRAMKPFLDFFGQSKINAGVYDGDTPVNERARIRANANIILTNPDILNAAFLPNHSKYNNNFIFANLDFVVIDELHSYRGAFGSHMSNIFKRLNRICKYYNTKPKYLCSSATINNPLELANSMCDKEFILIDKDGAPASQKTFKLIQPPFLEKTNFKLQINKMAVNIIPKLVLNNHHFITFCRSRNSVEVILKESREQLKYDGVSSENYADKIAGYRGGYKAEERKIIEKKMIDGSIAGLVSTNALELGIDIGKIDTTLLVGFPGTRASFWQQTGRSGRKEIPATNYMILDDRPFDQFIAVSPDWLFNKESENAIIDKDNIYIQMSHLRAAAAELPLTLDDAKIFSKLSEIIPILIKNNELRKENGCFVWCGSKYPAGDYSIRNMDSARYQMIDITNATHIEDIDELMAFKYCHDGSIYMHGGNMYRVEKIDLDTKKISVKPTNLNYFSTPNIVERFRIINELKSDSYKMCKYSFGDLNVTNIINGHSNIQFNNHAMLGFESMDNPTLSKEMDTEAVWIQVPEYVMNFFNKIEEVHENSRNRKYITYIESMAFTIKSSAMMTTMSSDEDISTGTGASQRKGEGLIYIYDNYKGGLGYSKKIYNYIGEIVQNAIKLVSNCSCRDGCSACVGDYNLDKRYVLWGLRNLLDNQKEVIYNDKIVNFAFEEISKDFKISTLKENWEKFVLTLDRNNEYLSQFVKDVKKVNVKDETIYLYVDNGFIKEWIEDINNIKQLKNIFAHYISFDKNEDSVKIIIKII